MVRAIVDDRLPPAQVARRFSTTGKTVKKWVDRFRAHGVDGLRDRSSRPRSSPSQTPLATRDAAEALRRERHTQRFHRRQARPLGRNRLGNLRRARPQPAVGHRAAGTTPTLRTQDARRDCPSRHQKLGKFSRTGHRITGDRRGQSNTRGAGWEFAHVAIDDHSRVARINIMPDQKKASAVTVLPMPSLISKASASPSPVS